MESPRGRLEVESKYELQQSAARIERDVRILVRIRHLVVRRGGTRLSDGQEVDRVEQIEDIDPELDIAPPAEIEALFRIQIEAGEDRALDKHVVRRAVPTYLLDAIGAVRRRQVAAGGRSQGAVAAGRGGAGAEGLDRVVDDVLRQHEDVAGGVVEANLVGVP